MSNLTFKQDRRVRFEEVTPTNTIVAFLDARLSSLVTHLHLPIYEGYDDLDDMQLAFLTLPSGQTVTLAQYENSPQIGVDLYVDLKTQDVPAVVFESYQYLEIPRSNISWFHPDFQEHIELLYQENSGVDRQIQLVEVDELSIDNSALKQHPPTKIDCFRHALRIYTKEDFPLYWAMLQHNLGLAYFDRTEGNRKQNLKKSIECFNSSLKIHRQNKFLDKWQINQDDLAKSKKSLSLHKKKCLIKYILNRPIPNRKLQNADFSGADLSHAKLIGADLSRAKLIGAYLIGAKLIGADLSRADLIGAKLIGADLSRADLSHADLSGADLSRAYLIYADLSHANVKYARFESTCGIPESLKQDLIARGAIFDDAPGDRSESKILVPR